MRAIIQRVSSASVAVDNEIVSQISRGLMVLVGIGVDDNASDIVTICNKILSLRVFQDAEDKWWKASVKDIDGEVLCVSQFTLMANTAKGYKPDFHRAMQSEASQEMYASFLQKLRDSYKAEKIKDGKFGAMMSVALTNEGPVTFTIDSRKFEYVHSAMSPAGDGNVKSDRKAAQVKPPSRTLDQKVGEDVGDGDNAPQ